MRLKRIVAVVLLVTAIVVGWFETQKSQPTQRHAQPRVESSVVQAFKNRQSDIWLDAEGVVDRVLGDDNEGSRHQRFVLRLTSGHTVLVAHNIDLAPRVPLSAGQALTLRGEYEWNERGGVIHWTHHDPQGRRDGGYIDYRGQRYE